MSPFKFKDEAPPFGRARLEKPYSSHPGDSYLRVVLVERDDEPRAPLVVWTHNMQAGGYFCGAYCGTLDDAFKAFRERGRD